MKILRSLAAAIGFLFLVTAPAHAVVTCFLVTGGGSVNWSDTTHWSSSSGGSGSTCAATGGYPHSNGDIATLDASSGGGTVTIDVDIPNGYTLTAGAYTGTLADTAHNVTWSQSATICNSGSTGTFNLGAVTWTFTSSNVSFIDGGGCSGGFTATSSTIALSPSAAGNMTFQSSGSHHWGTVTTTTASTSGSAYIFTTVTGTTTIDTFTVAATPAILTFSTSSSWTFTNAVSITGTASNPVYISGGPNAIGLGRAVFNFTAGMTCAYCAIWGTVTNAGALTATNSFNIGYNGTSGTGSVSITGPSAGGAGVPSIIGGL